jgi:hypothetical protein
VFACGRGDVIRAPLLATLSGVKVHLIGHLERREEDVRKFLGHDLKFLKGGRTDRM